MIIKRSLDPATGAVTLTVRTEDPDKHDRVYALAGDLPSVTVFERPDLSSAYVADGTATYAAKAGSAATADAADTATTSGEVSDGTISFTPAQIKALEDRIAALEP